MILSTSFYWIFSRHTSGISIIFTFILSIGSAQATVSPLFNYLHAQDLDGVRYALTSGEDPNQFYEHYSPLSYATLYFPQAIPLLLQKGSHINQLDPEKRTALMLAVRYNPHAIDLLLEGGASPNLVDGADLSPLMLAAMYTPLAIKPLVRGGAKVDAANKSGLTPLTHAILKNNREALQALSEVHANMNLISTHGLSPLKIAIIYNPEMIEDLVHLGAELNPLLESRDARTPLMTATECNQELIPTLLQLGAEVDSQTLEGYTALMLAATLNPEALPFLLEGGADTELKDHMGETALMKALPNNLDACLTLIEAGAHVNAQDVNEWSVLMFAVKDNPLAIKLLTQHGANLEYQTLLSSWTPLLLAACVDPISVRELLKAGANPLRANRYGFTPLATAVGNGNVKGTLLLLHYLEAIPDFDLEKYKRETLKNMRMMGLNPSYYTFTPDLDKAKALLEGEKEEIGKPYLWDLDF